MLQVQWFLGGLMKIDCTRWLRGSAFRATRLLALCLVTALSACGGGGSDTTPPPPPPPPPVVAPSIAGQPKAVTVVDGGTATFTVTASGTSLAYQWRRDGKDIPGATASTYVTPALQYTDNGAKFQVVITGPNASVTSDSVTLTVTPVALSVTAQPASQSVKDGDVVSFDVAFTGSHPVQIQWQRNGVAIAGADKATYTTSALTLSDDAAVFRAVLTNPAGSVTTQEAKLSVAAVPPRIVAAPESVTTTDGAVVTFKVVAAGSAPLQYQWLRNDKVISGATGDSFSTALDYASNGDHYAVRVANGAGQVTSPSVLATVNPAAPTLTQQPSDAVIATGGTAKFTALAAGTPPLSYLWQQSRDGGLTWTSIPDAKSNSYTVSNATLARTATQFRVAVTNAAATLNSNPANLTVRANVRVLAGTTGGIGYADGKGDAARMAYPNSMAADSSGNLYFADTSTSVIRRVSSTGVISLFAGQPNVAATVDGTLSEARFTYPSELAIDRSGNVFVAEYCRIRKITSAGVVVAFVGGNGCVTKDGTADQAGLATIQGMAFDLDGTLYVTERNGSNGQVLRKISPSGVITTLAGSAAETGKIDGVGPAARFFNIGKLVVDANKNVYVVDGTAVRLVSPLGEVSTFAGAIETYGQAEGYRTSARFGYINGLAFDGGGNLFVSDTSRISRISVAGNVVTAVASAFSATGFPLSRDGASTVASVGYAGPLASRPDGSIAFFDGNAYTVRVLTQNATVSTLVGGGQTLGFADGGGTTARFAFSQGNLMGMTLSPSGPVIITDPLNRRIRRMTVSSYFVDTLAGTGNFGSQDGPFETATLGGPGGVVYDRAGNLYVSDWSSNTIRRFSTAGVMTTLAGRAFEVGSTDGLGNTARFYGPGSMVMDSKGNLIVADMNNYVLRKITPDGMVSTIAGKVGQSGYVNGVGSEVRLGSLRYMAIDAADNVYFTDNYHAIRKLSPNGEVSTFAGAPYSSGLIDDIAVFARFNYPAGLAFDSQGNLFVADGNNHAIRCITPEGQVTTVIGGHSIAALRPGLGGTINQPSALVVLPTGRLVFVSEGAIVGD